MVERDLKITNRLGLHARAAAKLVHLAGGFESDIALVKGGDEVDAKSILGLLQLGAAQGTDITIRCVGSDEDEALSSVVGLIEDKFGEGT
ncbi:MAG: HPr family phosphocarrier protein [Thermoanaerobaculia bacterium]|nr:HPr family phosphocarrier protein [Thermoanaerobaculia bacterium]